MEEQKEEKKQQRYLKLEVRHQSRIRVFDQS